VTAASFTGEEKAMSESGTRARIVVGVDGSEGSKQALSWAARQARFTGAALEVIIAWDYPATYGSEPPASLQTRVVQGHAAQVLVDASQGAELLVVGSRGYGGFADALLGSVSTYCVHHAHGPITVVRP
jgi:nucleotide-binding universal stress UspA family protein